MKLSVLNFVRTDNDSNAMHHNAAYTSYHVSLNLRSTALDGILPVKKFMDTLLQKIVKVSFQ